MCHGLYDYVQTNLTYRNRRMASDGLPLTQITEIFETDKVKTGYEPKMNHPEYEMDYVRLTSAILGIQRGYEEKGIRPVASLKTKLLQIKEIPKGSGIGYWMTYLAPRDMRIGVAGIGYGDGLIRSLCAGAEMLVCGKRVPVGGKLSMSSCVLDLTDVPECEEGDTVTVFGEDGDEEITVHEYARLYGGHPCEVISMLRESIPKVYIADPARE